MKTALALCGGGSLGAYEVGVWKYLRENSFDFDIITGTSIGAINGAMIAQDQFDVALDMWKKISVGDIMANGIDFDRNFLKNIDLSKNSHWTKFVTTFFQNKGADTTPLQKMLDERIAPLHVNRGKKTLGIVVCRFPSFAEKDIVVNDLKDEDVVPFIMASASCWPVFPVFTYKGIDYVDGGWRNNLPIDFALKLGADKVVAVLLNSLPRAQRRDLFDLPNVTLIQPSLPQGSFLAFTHNAIESNMKMGYLDAAKTFGSLKGNRVTLENDPEFKDYCQRYYRTYLDNDPHDFLKVEKELLKGQILKIQDPIERAFILALEQIMDMYGISFRESYKIKDLMAIVAEKVKETAANREERALQEYIAGKQAPVSNTRKALWYFAQLLK